MLSAQASRLTKIVHTPPIHTVFRHELYPNHTLRDVVGYFHGQVPLAQQGGPSQLLSSQTWKGGQEGKDKGRGIGDIDGTYAFSSAIEAVDADGRCRGSHGGGKGEDDGYDTHVDETWAAEIGIEGMCSSNRNKGK